MSFVTRSSVPPAGSVNTAQLADDAVTNAKIAASAVDTAQLATGAVNDSKLGANSVGASELKAGAAGVNHFNTNDVTSAGSTSAGGETSFVSTSGRRAFFPMVHSNGFAGDDIVMIPVRTDQANTGLAFKIMNNQGSPRDYDVDFTEVLDSGSN